jgi:hypothetical protein
MKNKEKWVPTKYILKENKLKANSQYVAKSSIILTDKIADFYNNAIPKYANGLLIDLGCNSVPLYVLYQKYVNEVTSNYRKYIILFNISFLFSND